MDGGSRDPRARYDKALAEREASMDGSTEANPNEHARPSKARPRRYRTPPANGRRRRRGPGRPAEPSRQSPRNSPTNPDDTRGRVPDTRPVRVHSNETLAA